MSGFSNTDSESLDRIANALERSAIADERRNELLEAEMAERRESWAKSEAATAEAIERLMGTPQPVRPTGPNT